MLTTNEHLIKLLTSKTPGQELRIQHHSGLLKSYLPEVDALYGVPQRAQHHPEIDTGWHMELCLDQGRSLRAEPDVMFAILVHDLGKAITPAEILPRHHGHEEAGIPLVEEVCNRMLIGSKDRKLAMSVCENHIRLHSIFTHRSATISQFIWRAFDDNDFEYAKKFVTACWADASGRLGKQHMLQYNQGLFLLGCLNRMKTLKMPGPIPSSNSPEEHEVYEKRLDIIRRMRLVHDTNHHKALDSTKADIIIVKNSKDLQ